MDVLNEILSWSQSRPNWQREALRLLVLKGSLDQDDFDELLAHCKGAHGLADKLPFNPLSAEHIPSMSNVAEAVVLNTLTHEKGVNALANNQTIKFGKGLSIVYGQNAAGKSGYTRVLKKACRARGSEDILGNVLSDKAPSRPSVVLNYSIGPADYKWNWTDSDNQDPALGNVSVFDRHCATVYLSQKTDVAFRPFGLDLFDKLAACCEKIRTGLEKERQELNRKEFQPAVPPGTTAYALISEINALTNLDTIRAKANLPQKDLERAKELKRQIRELSDEDSGKNKRELELRLKRIQSFRDDLANIGHLLSNENLLAIQKSQFEMVAKGKVAKDLEAKFLTYSRLEGTGSEEWQALWNSASEFSKVAYPKNEFPVMKKGASCLLCQQELDNDAIDRFTSFQKLMTSSAQQDVAEAKADLEARLDELNESLGLELSESDVLAELDLENEEVTKELTKVIKDFESRVRSIAKLIESNKQIAGSDFKMDLAGLNRVEKSLQQRIKSLSAAVDKAEFRRLQQELAELEGRKALQESLSAITREIERQKQIAVYTVCIGDVGTTALTKKSTEVTKEVVTEHLISSFHRELEKLGFDHLEIDLQPSGASRGALYHKLVIKRATNIEVQDVVSEGEARALSIAAFFAELSTASNLSGILFDDPVSSLDHLWRERIARRLVEAAQGRQVIVFTHDIVFLSTLSQIAEELKVDISHQYIHREHDGAGVSSPDLPWVAMRVKDRIGVLKRKLQEVAKIEKTSAKETYEKEAAHVYGLIRETWERALEEVLIGGALERYRPSVQTLKVKLLADITAKDCEIFDAGMTKCSRWLPGHDNSAAESSPFPNSVELGKDIVLIESWVREINKRRN